MTLIKLMILLAIMISSIAIGVLMSKKYLYRVREIKDIKNALNIFITKIKFTYEPIPTIFEEIGTKIQGNVGKIFNTASSKMKTQNAGEAWEQSLEEIETNLKKEDIIVIKNLARLLGKTDLEGQISEIQLVNTFLDTQLELAENERIKNEKMYKTLGTVIGITIVIILI